ncbi:DUF1361 domain-containing protein [Spirosoma sp. BT702]|uniref:DUF1361 domain-containing protein n=1 Tax=Spirosoma profusum TaxID=2771354 RepID=A0A927ARE9_9BACT|nr:DUF1361 domain-containing protein [Spirosoma profusum]MBD2702208.1 DUF1361 domain-containing protein [Spirosoma profusum]
MQTQSHPTHYSNLSLPRDARPGKGLWALALLTVAGFSLVTLRGLLTGNWWYFLMLDWNLFLAWFPLGVVLVLRDLRANGNTVSWFRSRWLLIGSLLLWLAFLPNAPYIITDLYHINHIPQPLLWFDTMSIFLYAFTGLLIGLYSTLLVHRMLRPLMVSWLSWMLILASQVLSGFGIYLGRFGRWNSWDILTQPSSLTKAVAFAYQDHLSVKLTMAYGFVLVILYVAFYWYVEHEDDARL